MNCGEAKLALDALLDREIEREEEILLRHHLTECPTCAGDLEERRAFSGSLARSLGRALEGVESTPDERARLADRMSAPARRRAFVPSRLAALVAIGLSVGLVGWLLSQRPSPEQRVVAERLGELEAKDGQIEKLRADAARELDSVRATAAGLPDGGEAAQAVHVALWNLESRLTPKAPAAADLVQVVALTSSGDVQARGSARAALRGLEPARVDDLKRALSQVPTCDRPFVQQVVVNLEARSDPRQELQVVQNTDGVVVKLVQRGDGRVQLTVPGRTIEALNMADLRATHPDVCRQFGISGADGRVAVGANAAAMTFEGRLNLLFRTGEWDEDLPFEAYRAWISSRVADGREAERRVQELRDRCRSAGHSLPLPGVTVDLDAILKDVKALSRQELGKTRERVEGRLKELEARLKELSDLREKARGLRLFAENVRSGK